MNKQHSVRDWQRIWNKANDPEEYAKAKRIEDKKKRMEQKKSDVGL